MEQLDAKREASVTLPFGKGVTITRRNFLLGAVGVGAVAAAAAGVALTGEGEEDGGNDGISVAANRVSNIDDFEELSRDDCFSLIGSYELPFGSLVWTNNANVAACLIPTEQPSPITQVALLMLGTGNYFTVLEQAAGAADGFEILDVRASESGLVWTEANIMEGTWRIMCAPLSPNDATLGDTRMLEEGNRTFETPTIAAVGGNAYWQVVPVPDTENLRTATSYLKRAAFSQGNVQVLHQAAGRMCCPVYAASEGVVIAARNPEMYSNYDILYFDDASGGIADRLTLPSGMAPNALGYGPDGIAFCFENIYDYGDGIANLGTYTPAAAHIAGSTYDGLDWFRFGRTPQSGPCWCTDRWFMVKSTTSVCAVDIANRSFCSLDVESGCTDWGDYLATSGAGDTVVTIMQIDQVNTSGESEHHSQVRVWQALETGESAPVDEDQDGYDDNTGELIGAGSAQQA